MKDIEYLVTVTVDGKAHVVKRDYEKMEQEQFLTSHFGEAYLTKEDMRWIDVNVYTSEMSFAFVPEGKKKIILTTSKERQKEIALRDIYTEELKQVLDLEPNEKVKSFKFI